MSIQRVAAILAVAVGFFAADSVQAQTIPGFCGTDAVNRNPYFYPPQQVTRIIDVNCTPVRVSLMRQLPRYIPVPVPVPIPVYLPPVQPMFMGVNQQRQAPPVAVPQVAAPTPQPAPMAVQRPAPVLPREVNQTPAEPTVRMRYVELTVTGLQAASDGDKLTDALDKLKGSRGATLKRKAGGEAVVKVWYSEKDPLLADAVIQAVSRLGFAASAS